jgi:hypothetical protein
MLMVDLAVVLLLLAVVAAAAFFGEDSRDGRDSQARLDWPPHNR